MVAETSIEGCSKPLEGGEGWFRSGEGKWTQRGVGTRIDTHCGLMENSSVCVGSFCMWMCEECALKAGVKW